MITVTGSAINANSTLTATTDEFATSTGITAGYNVTESGVTVNFWTFTKAYGNFAGEDYNNDGVTSCAGYSLGQ